MHELMRQGQPVSIYKHSNHSLSVDGCLLNSLHLYRFLFTWTRLDIRLLHNIQIEWNWSTICTSHRPQLGLKLTECIDNDCSCCDTISSIYLSLNWMTPKMYFYIFDSFGCMQWRAMSGIHVDVDPLVYYTWHLRSASIRRQCVA